MAYDEFLAERIRHLIAPYSEHITEKKMFGGISFMYKGKMSVGIVKNDLCVRFLEDKYPDLLNEEHVRPMDFTGKPLKEMAFVSSEGFENEEDLKRWIHISIEHAEAKAES